MILKQSIHSLAKEGGVETIFGQRTDIVCLAAALGFSHGCLLRSILLEDELSKRKKCGRSTGYGWWRFVSHLHRHGRRPDVTKFMKTHKKETKIQEG